MFTWSSAQPALCAAMPHRGKSAASLRPVAYCRRSGNPRIFADEPQRDGSVSLGFARSRSAPTTTGIPTALPTQGFAYRLRNPQFRAQALPQLVERLGEAVRVRTFGLGERLEPVGDFLEAFVARGLRHARIHVG